MRIKTRRSRFRTKRLRLGLSRNVYSFRRLGHEEIAREQSFMKNAASQLNSSLFDVDASLNSAEYKRLHSGQLA
mgnify:FL=1